MVHYWFPLLQQVASNVLAANDSGSSELCWQIVVNNRVNYGEFLKDKINILGGAKSKIKIFLSITSSRVLLMK